MLVALFRVLFAVLIGLFLASLVRGIAGLFGASAARRQLRQEKSQQSPPRKKPDRFEFQDEEVLDVPFEEVKRDS